MDPDQSGPEGVLWPGSTLLPVQMHMRAGNICRERQKKGHKIFFEGKYFFCKCYVVMNAAKTNLFS